MRSSAKTKLCAIEKVFNFLLVCNVRNCSCATVWFQIMWIRNTHLFCCSWNWNFVVSSLGNYEKGQVIYSISIVSQVTTHLELEIAVHPKLTAHDMNMALRWPALDFQTHTIWPSSLPRACTPV